jgi:hypothetical protein
MKKKTPKKLTLHRETVRQLSLQETSWAAGGYAPDRTNEPFCVSDALTCPELGCGAQAV